MRDFIQSLTARLGINGLGRALGLNGSSVLAWVRGESLPSADLVGPLATLAQVEPAVVRDLLIREQTARAARRRARPQLGPAASPVVPLRKPGRAARRRKLAAWAFAVASVSALGSPLRVEAARLITGADSRDSVPFWWRRRLA